MQERVTSVAWQRKRAPDPKSLPRPRDRHSRAKVHLAKCPACRSRKELVEYTGRRFCPGCVMELGRS